MEQEIVIEERWAEIGGHRLRYLTGGRGPALLLLHGLLGYSFSWRRNLPQLARVATVYALDLPGVGFSERSPDYACDMRSLAATVRQFLEQVGVREVHLLGTSHGGGLAMMLAADLAASPDIALRSLILVAPVNPWSRHGRWRARLIGSRLGARLTVAAWPACRVLAPLALARMFGRLSRIPPGAVRGYLQPCRIPGTAQHVVKIAAHWNADVEQLRVMLARLRPLPTLVVWGTRDRLVAPRSARPLCECFDDAELHMLPGLGHLPYEEAPDEFNGLVCDFLVRQQVISGDGVAHSSPSLA